MSNKLTLDEILNMVSEIARDPNAGADRFRALKMLATTESQQAVLPEPKTQEERVERTARVIRGVGVLEAQLAFQKAFPNTKSSPFQSPALHHGDLSEADREFCSKVRTLKLLYKHFPAVKRHGFPPGYPVGRGLVSQQAWCQNAALKAMVDKRQTEMNERSREEASAGTAAPA